MNGKKYFIKNTAKFIREHRKNEFAIIIAKGTVGLGIIRSLGKEGVNSIVIFDNNTKLVAYSKYVIEKVKLNNLDSKENIFNALFENRNRWYGSLVIPGFDQAVETLSFHKKKLSKYYKIAVADYNVIEKLIDKKKTYKIADEAGVPRPKTWYPNSISEIKLIEKEIIFPCMVKPFKSHEFYSIFKKKLFIVNNIKQLKEKYEICKKHMIDVMLSEIIQGKDSNLYASYFYVDKNHQFVGGMTRQKLRQHPPKYGITNVSISKYNKTIFDLSEKFLKKIPNYSGIGYIEFKYDERDGKYKLIEMNARDVSWISLATSCGINFPFIQYNDMVKGKKVRITSFKENIYWIFLYNDVMDQFISKNRKLESFTFKEKASPYFHKKAFPIESLSDPKPMLFFWKSKLIGIFKRLIIKGFAHTICVFLMASLDIFE